MDDIVVDFGVGWYDYGARESRFGVGFVAAFLAVKDKTSFHENAFQNFPMDRRYAR